MPRQCVQLFKTCRYKSQQAQDTIVCASVADACAHPPSDDGLDLPTRYRARQQPMRSANSWSLQPQLPLLLPPLFPLALALAVARALLALFVLALQLPPTPAPAPRVAFLPHHSHRVEPEAAEVGTMSRGEPLSRTMVWFSGTNSSVQFSFAQNRQKTHNDQLAWCPCAR